MKRFLVVGSGSIARRHIANLRKLVPECEVACVSASGRNLGPGETGATMIFPGLEEAIAWHPLFAIVASPAPFHLANASALLEHSIPVLIEKPLSDSWDRFTPVAEVFNRHKHLVEVGYNLRYLSSAKRMKELVNSCAVGQISSVLVDMGQYLPDWRPGTDYRTNVSARRSLGGGVLLELSHEFDYVTWLFGKFDQVYCLASKSGQLEVDVEDRADVVLSRQDGVVVHLHIDFLQRRATRICKVIGEQGNLVWNLIENTITLENLSGIETIFADPNVDRNDMYLEQLKHFLTVANGDTNPNVVWEDALYVLGMIEAMRRSSAGNRAVSLEGKF